MFQTPSPPLDLHWIRSLIVYKVDVFSICLICLGYLIIETRQVTVGEIVYLLYIASTVFFCPRLPSSPLNLYYPRATRCGGDIVTLLWFRASVCAWFRPSVDLVNTIETKPLHISLSNLADMLTMMRGWTLLIFEVRGQRSRSQWRYIEISLWRRGDATLCVVIFSLPTKLVETIFAFVDPQCQQDAWYLV